MNAPPKRVRSGPLSNREREVFELLADGLSGAQIAEQLVLSPETVRTHIRNAMAKLGRLHPLSGGRARAPPHEITRQATSRGTRRPPPAPPGGARAAAAAERPRPSRSLDGLLSLWDVDAGWIYLADDDGLTLRQAVQRTRREPSCPRRSPSARGPWAGPRWSAALRSSRSRRRGRAR